jgi:hypothetical protein
MKLLEIKCTNLQVHAVVLGLYAEALTLSMVSADIDKLELGVLLFGMARRRPSCRS